MDQETRQKSPVLSPDDGVEPASFGWKDAVLIITTITSVIGLAIHPEVRAFVTNPWAWVYTVWVASALIWAIDRYRRINRWLGNYGKRLEGAMQSHATVMETHLATMDAKISDFDRGALNSVNAVIARHKATLETSRAEWARQLMEMIENAVEYKANLATVQAEAEARTSADARMGARFDTLDIALKFKWEFLENLEKRIKGLEDSRK